MVVALLLSLAGCGRSGLFVLSGSGGTGGSGASGGSGGAAGSGGLDPHAPRLIAPLSTSTVTSHTPTLRWVPNSSATVIVDIYRDRALGHLEQTMAADDGHTVPGTPLDPGVHFWRVRKDGHSSAVWELFVGARSAATDTSWGSTLDVNGDGYRDVAVDAVSESSQTGAVHVYEGGPSGLSTTPSATLPGPGSPQIFSYVANAGDLNGDGFADLVVGAPVMPKSGAVGRAYVYFGSATGIKAHPMILSAHDPETRFGGAVAGVGDVNGDGYGDLLVGADYEDSHQGRAYLYFGGPHGPGHPVTLVPPKPSPGIPARFGGAVAGAGDVDGDGLDDFIVAAPDQGDWGEVYLYRGSTNGGTPTIATELTTATTGEDPLVTDSTFGGVVACAGDVNGDGYANVLVTVGWTNDRRSGNVDVASNDGRVYVYLGGPSGLPVVPATEIEGPGTYAFGSQAASAGNVDGDGYSDIAIGAFGDGHTASVMGNAFVYRGGPFGVAPDPAVQLDGPDGQGGFFGVVSTSSGDLDGDGFADLVVAAYEAVDTAGRVYVFPGSTTGVAKAPSTTLTGPQGSNFGATLALSGALRRATPRAEGPKVLLGSRGGAAFGG